MKKKITRTSAEAAARRLLRPVLKPELALAQRCERVLRGQADLFDDRAPQEEHQRALAILLSRLADDLRACVLCASNGYILQMMTIASSTFEVGYTIAHMAADNQRAASWLGWTDLDRLPWTRTQMVAGGLRNALGDKHQRRVESENRFYKALCWAKHANPKLQASVPYAVTDSGHVLNMDPLFTPQSSRRARVAFYFALRPVIVALLALYQQNLLEPELATEAVAATADWFELEARLPSLGSR